MSNGPSGREWGDATRELAEVRHDLRTCRQIVVSQSEELAEIRHDLIRLRTRINTTLSVCAAIASAVVFLASVLVPIWSKP
jgi:predicted nucleic acid-binding protein